MLVATLQSQLPGHLMASKHHFKMKNNTKCSSPLETTTIKQRSCQVFGLVQYLTIRAKVPPVIYSSPWPCVLFY